MKYKPTLLAALLAAALALAAAGCTQDESVSNDTTDAALSVVLVAILLPRFGIAGYIVVLYVCEAFNAVCSLYRLLGITAIAVDVASWVGRPLAAIVIATVATRLFGWHYPAVDALSLAARLTVTAAVYLALVWGMERLHRRMHRQKHRTAFAQAERRRSWYNL